ncbi:hypothetical protein [Pseudoalteromonas ruthenica]|uniref:hypothetical protein n=1 Tax=Pseudoalteromonas ruthenica TaxID=151081 RepID=UPI00110BC6D2|nr:hypothetical protein [Pseudoalteromonas ruthenica]TMO43490.1 hypothetical protein CWC24_16060 [Pseudoalteromonas ruthenica]TMO52295.1 hypothetical protein CWC23_02980 [Pseudoalteromonas ruthenica]
MKYLVLSALFAIGLHSAFANDDLPVAPEEIIKEHTQMCLDWATEDDIDAQSQYQYVLDCVNDELSDNGYQHVQQVNIK